MENKILTIAAVLAATFLFWFVSEPAVENNLEAAETTDFRVYSTEEFRTEVVDLNLLDFYKDERWGEYAREKLGMKMIPEVSGTVYNAVEAQCDGSPLRTADGSYIDKDKVNSGDMRWIAVSRDLLKVFNYGDKVEVEGAGEKYDGVWEIHDTMNSRFTNQIDFLVPDDVNVGLWRGTITLYSVVE